MYFYQIIEVWIRLEPTDFLKGRNFGKWIQPNPVSNLVRVFKMEVQM